MYYQILIIDAFMCITDVAVDKSEAYSNYFINYGVPKFIMIHHSWFIFCINSLNLKINVK